MPYYVFSYPNGDIYDGQWQDNVRHGKGSYTFAENGSQYCGQWVKGKGVRNETQSLCRITYPIFIFEPWLKERQKGLESMFITSIDTR